MLVNLRMSGRSRVLHSLGRPHAALSSSRQQCRTDLGDLPIHSHRLRTSLLHMDLQTQVRTVLLNSLPAVRPRKTWLTEVLHVQAVGAVVELRVQYHCRFPTFWMYASLGPKHTQFSFSVILDTAARGFFN